MQMQVQINILGISQGFALTFDIRPQIALDKNTTGTWFINMLMFIYYVCGQKLDMLCK